MPRKRQVREQPLPWGAGYLTVRGEGRVQATWYDQQRKRRFKTFRAPTTKAAREAARKHVAEMTEMYQDGRFIESHEMTVRDLIVRWLDRGAINWKPTTVASFRQRAEDHLLPVLGDIRLADLTRARVQHWVDGLSRAGLAPTTVEGIYHLLRSACLEAVDLEILARSPASRIDLPTTERKPVKTWTQSEVNAVLAHVADDPMWHALYRLVLTLGMRPGELRALRWDDLDREQGILSIRRTMSRDVDGRGIVGDSTKTKKERHPPLSQVMLDALIRWRKEQNLLRLASRRWDGDYIFTGQHGKPLSPTIWRRRQDKIERAAGVKRVKLHELRHTVGTLEMAAGTPTKIISDRLGHSSTAITMDRYQHVDVDIQRKAIEDTERRQMESS